MYRDGSYGEPQNYAEAFSRWFRKAAEQNLPDTLGDPPEGLHDTLRNASARKRSPDIWYRLRAYTKRLPRLSCASVRSRARISHPEFASPRPTTWLSARGRTRPAQQLFQKSQHPADESRIWDGNSGSILLDCGWNLARTNSHAPIRLFRSRGNGCLNGTP